MARSVLPYVLTLVGGATIGVAAYQSQQTRPLPANEPGHPTPPYVLVINHGQQEAIPVAFAGKTVVGLEPDAAIGTVVLPQAWLYRSVNVRPQDDVAAVLAASGADGWEAVGVTAATTDHVTVLLKRPRDPHALPR
jgi:hypothetical protein